MNNIEIENVSFINTEDQGVININKNASSDKCANAQTDCNKIVAKPTTIICTREQRIQNQLDQAISDESRNKIANLLDEVGQLSDIEKLFLYVQLPTGAPTIDPFKQRNLANPLGKKADAEILQTCSWIQTHLMEDPDVSLPKHEVYEEYRGFCESNGFDQLCAADFGKVMKHVFPSVKPRRLGTRGNSRYCYSGLRKKLLVECPLLPNLNVPGKNKSTSLLEESKEVNTAACHLIFEWAEKLFTKRFSSMRELALHLVENLYIDTNTLSAMTILSSSDKAKESGLLATKFLKEVSGKRQKETSSSLQVRFHEKHLTREQKKKLKGTLLASRSANEISSIENKLQNIESASELLSHSQEFKESTIATEFEISVAKKHPSTNNKSTDIQKEQENTSYLDDNTNNRTLLSPHNYTENEEPLAQVPEKSPIEKTVFSSPYSVINSSLDTSDTTLHSLSLQMHPNCTKSRKLPQSGIKYKHIKPKPKMPSQLFPINDKHETTEGKTTMIKDAGSLGRTTAAQSSWNQSNYELDIINDDKNKSESNPISVYNDTSHKIIRTDTLQLSLNEEVGNLYEYLINRHVQNKSDYIKDEMSSSTGECESIKRQFETLECSSPSKRIHMEQFGLHNHKGDRNSFPSTGNLETLQEKKSHNISSSAGDLIRSNHEDCHFDSTYIHSEQNMQERRTIEDTKPESVVSDDISFKNSRKDNSRNINQLSQLRMLLERNLPQTTVKQKISRAETRKLRSEKSSFSYLSSNKVMSKESKGMLLEQTLLDNDKIHLNTNPASDYSTSVTEWQDEFAQSSNEYPVTIFTEEDRFGKIQMQPVLAMTTPNDNFQNSQLAVSGNNANSNYHDMSTSNLNLSYSFNNSQKTHLDHPSYTLQQASDAAVMENVNIPLNPIHGRPLVSVSSGYSALDHLMHYSSVNSCHQSVGEASIPLYPSQPNSIASSPFISPRNTPISFPKCAYNYESSNQGNERQFQNYSNPNSPFISPQSTPMPVNRLRHHSCQNMEQINLQELSTPPLYSTSLSRTRHLSGSVGPTTSKNSLLMSTNELYSPSYQLLSGSESCIARTRCDSFLPISSTSIATEPQIFSTYNTHTSLPLSETSISQISNQNMTKIPINMSKQLPQYINSKTSQQTDLTAFDQEKSLFSKNHNGSASLINYSKAVTGEVLSPVHKIQEMDSPFHNDLVNISNRCHSVPPNKMVYALVDQYSPLEHIDTNTFSKSYPTTPVIKHTFQFPIFDTNSHDDSNTFNSGQSKHSSQTRSQQMQPNDWNEGNRQRIKYDVSQNCMVELLTQPLEDVLTTTIEDCNEFSKFAQQLEEMNNSKK